MIGGSGNVTRLHPRSDHARKGQCGGGVCSGCIGGRGGEHFRGSLIELSRNVEAFNELT